MYKNRTVCRIAYFAAFLVFAMLAKSCAGEKPARIHLNHFSLVCDITISPGGRQFVFTGCGHKDYAGCTIYRYDREEGILYRYIYPDTGVEIRGPRYWSDPKSLLFVTVPLARNGKRHLDDMQIASLNQDGTTFKELTEGKSVKMAYMMSPDGKTLVYTKGKERTSGRTLAAYFDYYARNLGTGEETRLTRLTFYEATIPYFTPDGKNVVFIYGSPQTLPETDDSDAVAEFKKTYKEKYKGNLIIQYPVDGSGINRLPEPLFLHSTGSRNPIVGPDGSIWFESPGWIQQYRRLPDGTITPIPKNELGIAENQSIREKALDASGHFMAILYENIDDIRTRSARIFDTLHKKSSRIYLPESATNITIQKEE